MLFRWDAPVGWDKGVVLREALPKEMKPSLRKCGGWLVRFEDGVPMVCALQPKEYGVDRRWVLLESDAA